MLALRSLLRAALLTLLVTAAPGYTHEGHDHEQKPPAIAAALPRLEAASGPLELVAVLRAGELVIYLDRFATNEPITTATITVETPRGPQEAELKDSSYRLNGAWAQQGSVDLIFTVTEGADSEILAGTLTVYPANEGQRASTAGQLAQDFSQTVAAQGGWVLAGVGFAAGIIAASLFRRRPKRVAVLLLFTAVLVAPDVVSAHEGHDHADQAKAPTLGGESSQRLADGSLFVPKPVQRILAIRTVIAQTSKHRNTIELPGRIIPDPNASGFVQASVSGRLSRPANGFPKLGTAVKAGDVLAYVTPPFQAIDVSDMRQKAGELDQQIDIVSKRVARYEPLLKSGAVARVTYDDAVMELKGLRDRRAALDRTRADTEKLVAPVSGMIAAANAVAGQIADANAVVFQIVDPTRLWVEALTFSLLPEGEAATARTSEGATLALEFQGAGLTDRSQAIPVHYAIKGSNKGLRVGQLVTVLTVTGEEVGGLALPRAAVLRSANGQTVLFEHTNAERFEARIVRVQPLDAEHVLVLEGVAAGKRVVVQGAELLNQIR
jgi:cobalt-zinc-cadmium efflux system membrane fusion protein